MQSRPESEADAELLDCRVNSQRSLSVTRYQSQEPLGLFPGLETSGGYLGRWGERNRLCKNTDGSPVSAGQDGSEQPHSMD